MLREDGESREKCLPSLRVVAGESASVRKAGRELDLLLTFGPYSSVRAAKVARVVVLCGRRAGGHVTDPIGSEDFDRRGHDVHYGQPGSGAARGTRR